ncbi:glycoside hydrolase family 38 N-terminal domain-containing protein [Enterococcus massiliensis]|uniref:glycoside hydrolase family 38 N-terminal domain-containing protein n=1 Tax=Enterococcus massiliensis TaxID=1640685 RepID=UPI00065E711B|nr:glycoside hydrolase family 38 C-terminal domain-containing protein [Enterococcus massiliensis]
MKKKVFVVPHSHWDREWYFSIEDSNVLLTENMSQLLTYLENHSEFPTYTFDGQYSVIEEYLKYKPEDRQRVHRLIKSGRLHIGPWYTQGDTLLVQTESIIRNLLLGKQGAEKMGHSMNIGYLPDIFGQNSYLPSIFKRFGIGYSILQRGVYNNQLSDDLNFWWQSPNGERIPTNNLFLGYGPGKFLASDKKYVEETLLPMLKKLEMRTKEDSPVLLPAGGDQVFIRTHFPKVIQELNHLNLDYEFILSDYESFMEQAWMDTNRKTISGELIASQNSRIHNTIRSQRVDIKQLNSRVEDKLYKQLEPLAVLSKKLGGNYPQTWINHCLKLLFDVHAHDSIGGCNSDETNGEIINRLRKIERIIDDYINILKKQISRGILKNHEGVIAFNLLPKAINKQLEFILFTKNKHVLLKDSFGETLSQVIKSQEYISGGTKVQVTADGEKQIALPGYYRTSIVAQVSFSGFGYRRLNISDEKNQLPKICSTGSISNEFYRIEVINGQIQVERFDGKKKKNLFDFENRADAGDSYDFSPLANDKPNYSSLFRVIEVRQSAQESEITVETNLNVANDLAHFDEKKKKLVIVSKLKLIKGSDVIRIQHTLNNEMKDHRVRMRFFTTNEEQVNYADQGYSLIKRTNENDYLDNWKAQGFVEAPQPIYPLERFVSIPEKDGNVTVFTEGLKEYEAKGESLAITLFRSVGLLGKDNLAWRPGRASGINNKTIETPNAQMLGELQFTLGYRWGNENLEPEKLYTAYEDFSCQQLTYQLQYLNSYEERVERFELPQPENLINLPSEKIFYQVPKEFFVATLKKAENTGEIIIRLFNPEDRKITLPVEYRQHIRTLDEKKFNDISKLGEKDFVTLALDLDTDC